MERRDVLIVDGLCDAIDAGWLSSALLGQLDGPRSSIYCANMRHHIAQHAKLWGGYSLQPTLISLNNSDIAAVRAGIESGVFGAVILANLSETDDAVERHLGETLRAFVHGGGAICVLAHHVLDFEEDDSSMKGGFVMLKRVFGVRWQLFSDMRLPCELDSANATQIARCFGGTSPLRPHSELSSVYYQTKQLL
eukprot:CAMPEP_0119430886 /NCGR_PEP_ID=MMETSP1335-20130426/44918_1 /TAXON_ID=259385 /ORGANISM="Chrysoculter rhomboideus, Strain RCC1486" /LENGTH=193 /DNA_ID=CAMNT_0007456661 /DNA_START=67 /DNA_END=645 /DNA_ORIENTATION=-